jgi:hypothetical protein
MTAADYAKGPDGMTGTSDDNTWYTSPSYCGASFSGVPGCSNFNLGPNACITVNIGDNLFDECGASSSCANTPLECDTEYVFRSFARNVPQGLNKSDFSATITCKTDPCGGGNQGGCTYTQGFWKTHGTEFCIKGNNANEWPQSILDNGLTIGTVHYTAAELCTIFNTQGKQGNKLPALAHQIIAAQLNIANGADPTDAQAALAAADLLIGSLNILTDTYTGSDASTLTDTLTDYNEGTTGPGHCSDEVIEQ